MTEGDCRTPFQQVGVSMVPSSAAAALFSLAAAAARQRGSSTFLSSRIALKQSLVSSRTLLFMRPSPPGCAALEEPPADSTRRPPRVLMRPSPPGCAALEEPPADSTHQLKLQLQCGVHRLKLVIVTLAFAEDASASATIASCSSPDLAGWQALPSHLLHPRTSHGPEPRHKLASGRPPIRKGRCGGKPRTATTHSQCGSSIGFLRNGPGTSRHAVDTNIGKTCCQAVQTLAQAPPARCSRAIAATNHHKQQWSHRRQRKRRQQPPQPQQ